MEVSNIVREIRSANGTLTYQVGTRNAATSLRLKDGETQILAGLINKEDRKTSNQVPGLGQLPIVGRLFSSDSDTVAKTEVVLLITPHVVRNIIRPESPVEEFSSGTESVISLDRLEINTAQDGQEEAEAVSVKADAAPVIASEKSSALGRVKLALDAPHKTQSGGEFAVRVNLVAEGLQNALLDMSFDPAKFKVVKVEEGDLLNRAGGQTQFLHQIQDKAGRVNISVTRKGNIQGEGSLVSLTFQPFA